MIDLDIKEGDPQWTAYLVDRVCPVCGSGIADVVQMACRCAGATPCGHKVLHGDNAAAQIHEWWEA